MSFIIGFSIREFCGISIDNCNTSIPNDRIDFGLRMSSISFRMTLQ
jgi:hypothetical protein